MLCRRMMKIACLMHISAQGEIEGRLQTKTLVAQYDPLMIAGKKRPAILWTTAASIAAVIEMVSTWQIAAKRFCETGRHSSARFPEN